MESLFHACLFAGLRHSLLVVASKIDDKEEVTVEERKELENALFDVPSPKVNVLEGFLGTVKGDAVADEMIEKLASAERGIELLGYLFSS